MALIKLSNKKKRRLLELADRAMVLAGQGQDVAAHGLCAQADSEYKDYPDIMYARGLIASTQQDYATASVWFGRAYQAAPKRVEFKANYAGCLLMQHEVEKAGELYRQALAQSPHLTELAYGYGAALASMGEFRQAIQVLDKALIRDPRNVALLKKLATTHSELAENEVSLALLGKAHAVAPGDTGVLYEMGVYLVQLGELEQARSRFREVRKLDAHHVESLAMLINSGSYDEREADVAAMREIYDQAEQGSEAQIVAAFVLGSVADRSGQFNLAFEYWSEGNYQRRLTLAYDEAEQALLHQAAANAFPAARFVEGAGGESSAEAPLFIVGMPRSGSTLLEQALSRHPALQAAGEMYAMQQSIVGRKRKVLNPRLIEQLTSLDDDGVLTVGREYTRCLTQQYGLKGRVIDKALNNYLYAGLIAKAIPEARIIHVRREPMASCLSMFQQDFVNVLPYAFELEEMGRQYARYEELMQHWREVLPAGVMIEVDYEDLVVNPEVELRRLLQACGLDWHEDCLNAHEAGNVVTTSSRFQVRRPIHQQSVARWKHYEQELAPFRRCR